MKRLLLILVLALTPACARATDDHTRAEVIAAIGTTPAVIQLATCGEETDHPWQCRIMTWYRPSTGDTLKVVFKVSDGFYRGAIMIDKDGKGEDQSEHFHAWLHYKREQKTSLDI